MVEVIGLTGGIASGKSTVSGMLKEKGYKIVDADLAARAVVEPDMPAYKQIVEAFGEEILLEDGAIDRIKLGAIVFHDEGQRSKLNSIVHPAVRQHMLSEKEEIIQAGGQTVVMDIPLLYESQLTWMVDRTIVVYVDEETQLQRLMNRNNLDEADAKARIAPQLSLKEKVKLADAVIDNTGTLEHTEEQLTRIIEEWKMQP